MSTSLDGTRLFVAHIKRTRLTYGPSGRGDIKTMTGGNGMGIYDVSEIQQRKPNPQVRLISALEWTDGQIGQHSIHVVKAGKPYVIHVERGRPWRAAHHRHQR